jgi:hypothetical protein
VNKQLILNKKIAFPLIALTMVGATLIGGTQVLAEARGTSDTLVQRIAERFNLNQSEVQAVFDEVQQERHREMEAQYEARLNQAVADGKITEQQKQLILDKREELKRGHESMRESFENLSKEEAREKFEAQHMELKAWAEEHDIDLSLLGHGDRVFIRKLH